MSAAAQSSLRLRGRRPLHGSLRVHGAKNAALPCLAAALLTDQPTQLLRVPPIEDVDRLRDILTALGVETTLDGAEDEEQTLTIDPARLRADPPPDQLAAALRASFLVMGPLLARCGQASCGQPGGDVIGARPLDVHLAGFRALGATVATVGGRTVASAPHGLRGADLVLDYPSVLGTENLLLAAVLAQGRTRIINAAMEPEIVCLADLLNRMGARVGGAGTHTLTIDGVPQLHGARHPLIPDRIETGTLLIAAAASHGHIQLDGVEPSHLAAPLTKLREMGIALQVTEDQIELDARGCSLRAVNVQALPYPGFATDLQAPMTALLTQAHGSSVVHERVFENRMQHLDPLRAFGANLIAGGAVAAVNGPAPLTGAVVRGSDIRTCAALIVAALAADGPSQISGLPHLQRGYANLPAQLQQLGADIDAA